MALIPKLIDHGHIVESIVELRVIPTSSGSFLVDLLAELRTLFTPGEFQYVANDIPFSIRQSDPQMMYQFEGNLKGKQFSVGVGPRSIVFNCVDGYKKWDDFSNFIFSALELVGNRIELVERVGVRYTNLFEGLDDMTLFNVSFNAGNSSIYNHQQLVLKFSSTGPDISYNVSFANNAVIPNRAPGMLIDVDAYVLPTGRMEISKMKLMIDFVHSKEKEMFFSILKPELINRLNPKY